MIHMRTSTVGCAQSVTMRRAHVAPSWGTFGNDRSPKIFRAPVVDKHSPMQFVRGPAAPLSTSSSNGTSAATASAIPDESITPLLNALNKARANLEEAQTVREGLEAEAQKVAEMAVEAREARVRAQDKLASAKKEIESLTTQRAATQARADKMQAQAKEVSAGNKSTQEYDLAYELQQLGEADKQLAALSASLPDLEAAASAAVAAAARADEMAAAAMQAVESAVKEEMESKAVFKATKQTLVNLQDTISAMGGKEDAKEVKEVKETQPVAADSAADAEEAAPPPKEEGGFTVSRKLPYVIAGLLAMAAFSWFTGNTPQGREVDAVLQGVLAQIPHPPHHMQGYIEAMWLLAASCICVPAVCRLLPGGSPVLGYLLAGGLVGPHALGLISDVHAMHHLAEMGVVFLLFMIGLELSLDRLQSMAKFVFGMGSAQVLLSLAGVAGLSMLLCGLSAPSAIILGGALAMSSTAVAIQVLEDRKEMGSRHGRAIFSVLLFQDLAVVVLLMLIPLLAPSPDGSSGGLGKIAQALGIAGVKAVACIVGIIAFGRMIIQPLFKKISSFNNSDLFSATSILVCLATAIMTQLAGLSLALGAFLSGLLIAETEYAMQVESDIAPYKGMLMGLFFMVVGMDISMQLFFEKWQEILATVAALIVGKVGVMLVAGRMFGLSTVQSLRSGLLLAPGSEFAFVAFGEAVSQGVLTSVLCAKLYLAVALSMALTPYLAAAGAAAGSLLEKNDTKTLAPDQDENKELRDHVIILGYGRTGKIIAQLLSAQVIPFVALDTSADRVQSGRAQDLPVYFGDAGSPSVLHHLGAERAACAIVALDSPGANYRTVWNLHKHFPNLKLYVRAHDVAAGVNLEKAGASAVVPETLEPSLQLAAAVLREMEYASDDITSIVDDFRRENVTELRSMSGGYSLGYGYERKGKDAEGDSGADKQSSSVPAVALSPA